MANGILSFFFFQAEDGIRDIGVTGVQTCALPIWAGGPHDAVGRRGERVQRRQARARVVARRGVRAVPRGGRGRLALALVERSEERRVGKECRSRWSA